MDETRVVIRIFNSNLDFLGEVDNFTSLFYVRKWNTYGEFEFHVSNFNSELLQKGNIIIINNDSNRSGIIEHIEINEENGQDIKVKGYGLLYTLSQRLTVPPKGQAEHSFISTKIEEIMYELVEKNAINTESTINYNGEPIDSRKIPGLKITKGDYKGDLISFKTRYKNLLDELTDLSRISGLGLTIDFDYSGSNKSLVFKVLRGKDLSVENNDNNQPSIFSVDYDNVRNQNYITSNIGYKNCAYVAGKGEGIDRILEVVNENCAGFERREIIVDAKDIEDESELLNKGVIELEGSQQISTYECEVDPIGYRKYWNIGDIVTTINKKYGIRIDSIVSEVKETYESDGLKIEPTFGTIIPTTKDKIEKASRVNLIEGITGSNGSDGKTGPPGSQGVQGPPGVNGITPTVGSNGNWYLGSSDTGKPSRGVQGSQGPAGQDGTQIITQSDQPSGYINGRVWVNLI